MDSRAKGGPPGGFVPSLSRVKVVTLPKCKSAQGPSWGYTGTPQPAFPLTATLFCSLCDHWDFLPGLLHGPLQLSVTIGPEAAIWQMQVRFLRCPLPSPTRPLAPALFLRSYTTAFP